MCRKTGAACAEIFALDEETFIITHGCQVRDLAELPVGWQFLKNSVCIDVCPSLCFTALVHSRRDFFQHVKAGFVLFKVCKPLRTPAEPLFFSISPKMKAQKPSPVIEGAFDALIVGLYGDRGRKKSKCIQASKSRTIIPPLNC